MELDPGYPTNGAHSISVNGHWVGDQKAPGVDNIVVNNRITPFYFRWLNKNPTGCTYEISLGNKGAVNQWVREDVDKWVNVRNGLYQQWVLNEVANGTYTIALPGTNLVWTDMGDNKQIQLKPYNYNDAKQRFHIN